MQSSWQGSVVRDCLIKSAFLILNAVHDMNMQYIQSLNESSQLLDFIFQKFGTYNTERSLRREHIGFDQLGRLLIL